MIILLAWFLRCRVRVGGPKLLCRLSCFCWKRPTYRTVPYRAVHKVMMNGPTSSDWNGASYILEVGTTVPGQTQSTGQIIARGSINEVRRLKVVESSHDTINIARVNESASYMKARIVFCASCFCT